MVMPIIHGILLVAALAGREVGAGLRESSFREVTMLYIHPYTHAHT